MRAHNNGSGMNVTLLKEDKERGLEDRMLECVIDGWNNPKLIMHIVDELPREDFRDKSFYMEEPGFHIEGYPLEALPIDRTHYDLYMELRHFEDMTNTEDVIEGGHFHSRCRYDRVDMNYWPL